MNSLLINTMFTLNFENSFEKRLVLKKKLLIVNKNFLLYLYNYKFFKILKLNNKFFVYSALKNKNIFTSFKYLEKKLKKKNLFIYCNFCYSKIFLKVGLGFRKKYFKKFNSYLLNIGLRKWAIFKTFPSAFFFNIKRRNIFIFSNTKKKLYFFITHLKYLRKETVYKVKGIMTLNRIVFNKKISRSILFARRVKFKALKLKLTKKQKQRR